MTSTHITADDTHERARARQALVPAAVAVALLGSALSGLYADSRGEAVGEVIFIPLLTAAIFGLVVARGLRHTAAGGRGIAMGVIGLLAVPVAFWSGLPLVLGTAATLLGHAGKRADRGSGKAIAALVLGLLSVIGYVGIYVGDYLHAH
jgi:FtsH-binding integral membrane protein